jgi:hypothetical protein
MVHSNIHAGEVHYSLTNGFTASIRIHRLGEDSRRVVFLFTWAEHTARTLLSLFLLLIIRWFFIIATATLVAFWGTCFLD